MKKGPIVILLFLVVGFSVATAANAGKIYGIITYKNGSPAADVVLHLNNSNVYTVSDDKGYYELSNIPFGVHSIIVKPFGSKVKIINIELNGNELKYSFELADAKQHQELKEVMVKASSQSRQLKGKGYAVSVVETQKIALQSVQTMELLDRTAGIRIRQSGGMGSNVQFNINGLSGNSVRIFIDGIPIRNYGASFSLSSIPPAQIERIEVYKGVIPPHLSEDALGGAINVVLKKGMKTDKSLQTSYSFGSFNTHQASITGNYRNEKNGFTALASAFYNYTDNSYKVWGNQVFVSEPPTWSLQYVKTKRFHDIYQSYGLNADLGFTNVKWADRFLVGVLYSDMDKDVQHGGTMEVVYGNRRTGQSTKMLNARYEKSNILKKLSVTGFVSMTEADRWVVDTVPYIYNWLGHRLWDERQNDYFKWNVGGGEAGKATLANNKERTFAGRGNLIYEFLKNQKLNVNYLFNAFTRDIVDPLLPAAEQELTDTRYLTKQIVGLSYDALYLGEKLKTSVFWKYYLQDVSLKEPVKVNNVLTQKSISKSVDNNGYGIAIAFNILPKWQLLSSFEKAIRLPESTELLGNTSENVQASYELNPESSYNFNVGLNVGPFEKNRHSLRSDINFFYRDIRDMIMRGAESTSSGNYSFENLGQILSRGFDFETNYNYNKKLAVAFNLSLFNARYNLRYDSHGAEYSYYGDRLRNAPYFTSNSYVEYDFGSILHKKSNLKINYNLGYVYQFYRNWESIGGAGKAIIPTQMTHDLGAVYAFPDSRITCSINGKNLLNAQAFDNWALQKPGRAVYAKISYRIL